MLVVSCAIRMTNAPAMITGRLPMRAISTTGSQIASPKMTIVALVTATPMNANAVIGIMMMPWKLYADAASYIFTWLIGYSSLMGAIGGILIADYWVLRRRELSTADLFAVNGQYSYTRGVNRRAIVALIVAVLPVIPGFIRAAMTPGGQVASPTLFDTLYTYAWFVTFALAAVVYLGLSGRSGVARRTFASPRGEHRSRA